MLYNKTRGVFPSAPLRQQEKEIITWELEEDMTTEETRRVKDSYWRTWCAYHARWFGAEPPVLPMTTDSVMAVAAQMKAYGNRSYPNYLAARERHKDGGFDWTQEWIARGSDASRRRKEE